MEYKDWDAYEDLENGGYYKTTKYWSRTTSRHINQWLPDDNLGVNEIEQSELDNLLKEEKTTWVTMRTA